MIFTGQSIMTKESYDVNIPTYVYVVGCPDFEIFSQIFSQ